MLLPKSVIEFINRILKAGYGRHSETERVLVNNDSLASLSLLKIQSGHPGNLVEQPFDGDEMNMHQPQNILAETELRHLAAIPYQIISPSSNSPIIGMYQDSLLGAYEFTRGEIEFDPRTAMNLLMSYPKVDTSVFKDRKNITNFEILSQIMPPISLKYKTSGYNENEDEALTKTGILEIKNGKYIRGQADKNVFGSGSKGILHRVYNDYGHTAAYEFIDNIQQVITDYMKTHAFSVGVSDLICDKKTNESILQVIAAKKNEVQEITNKIHMGVFENNTGKSNMAEYENQVGNILNDAINVAGKLATKSLGKTNRFVTMVSSGSKGSPLNMSQMLSCLGQTSVDGKRVPYGFDNRTLPHYSKYDDSPSARGFIESSYISGLSAPELFFHAMGGRIGLIDTAIKSVTWETPIIVVDNGKPLYTEIGKWVDGKLDDKQYESVIKKYGPEENNMELLNVDSIYIPTTDENGVVSWEEVTAVTRHDPGKVLYEIKTQSGRNVTVTESKSLLIWNEEKKGFYEMLTPDIKIGDCVPVTAELSEPLNSISISYDECFNNGYNLNGFEPTITLLDNASATGLLSGFFTKNIQFEDDYLFVESCDVKLLDSIGMLLNRLGIFVEYKNGRIAISAQWGQRFAELIPLIDNAKQLKLNKIVWRSKHMNYKTHNNVVLDPITEITPISPELHPKMYDLTIPTTLNFGLANGLQVRDTSSTGYIQRRLIKGLEDLKVEYDMTVRNNMGRITQFAYGDDSIDTTKVENQSMRLVTMSIEDVYMHYDIPGLYESSKDDRQNIMKVFTKGASTRIQKQKEETRKMCKKYVDFMLTMRDNIVKHVFKGKNDTDVRVPVAFQYLIQNIQGQLDLNSQSAVDITPLECMELVEEKFQDLSKLYYTSPSKLFEVLYYFYLSPKDLLLNKRFNKKAILLLLDNIEIHYRKAIVHPGEMVGVIAGQSIGEPTTQMTLNSFTYETEILVKDHNGKIAIKQIGEFVNHYIEMATKREYYSEKDTTYAELNEYWEVPSVDENGNVMWKKIEAVTKHPVINEDGTNTMLKVTTREQREVVATKAKSFLKLVDGQIQPLRGDELSVGDYLPVNKKPYSEMKTEIKTIMSDNINNVPIVNDLYIPNCVNGKIVMELKGTRMPDIFFDEVISIEEVPNTTEYAYDLTVADTKNFNLYNGLCVRDTFHSAGVASKSNVTRGVPRIEEILRLTKNPKNPSMTIALKQEDQQNKDKAVNFCNMIQHTTLIDLVKSVQICYDPDDNNTRIHDDKALIDQFYEFEKMVAECNHPSANEASAAEQANRSKWIIRIEMNADALLDKNISMDDIHFAITQTYGNEVYCVFSDFNSSNLVFRVRMNTSAFRKSKRGNALDQSDDIFILKNFQDSLLNNIVIRGITGVSNVMPRPIKNSVVKEDGKFVRKDTWVLDTVGTNMIDLMTVDFIDYFNTFTNDIREIYDVLGIEAARQSILNEFNEVMEFSGGYVNYHHLSVLCDRMTVSKKLVPIFRSGIMNDDTGPIAKATFEMHTEAFLDASRHGEFDQMRGVSANVMCGQPGYYGTNAFQVVLDMKAFENMDDAKTNVDDVDKLIEDGFKNLRIDETDECSKGKIMIDNNIRNLATKEMGVCLDDGYNLL